MSIGVLVVGDIGRSPRMQNHAVELSRNFSKKEIYMIGYDETPCSIEFIERENINVLNLSHGGVDKLRKYLPTLVGFLIFALCKVVFQTISLFFVLIKIPRLEAIIVQSPPAIPALIVVWIACKIKKSKMIVDIHNYGYSILSLSVSNKILVKVAASIERFFVRRADITFTVSKAMSKDVFNSWGLKHAPKVLFDVPPTRFQPPTHSTIHEVLLRLLDADDLLEDQKQSIVKNLSVKMNKNIPSDLNKTFKTLPALPDKVSRDTIGFQPLPSWSSNQISILTNKNGFLPRAQNMTIAEALKSNQAPVFAISCTSWTPDEDFNILLNALVRYDRQARKTLSTLPPLLMVITGKGAMRDIFFQNAASMNMTHVALVSLFVPADLYPAFIGSADFGICMHQSSSGLDLPMKVVDMIGVGLPVLARRFSAIEELLPKNEKTNALFSNDIELCDRLMTWVKHQGILDRIHKEAILKRKSIPTWEQEWKKVAKTCFI